MASACSPLGAANPSTSSQPLMSPTAGMKPDSSSRGSSSRSTTSPTGWLTFTNPQGLYSIEYPASIGDLTVEYRMNSAVLSWGHLDGTFDVTIGWFDNLWPVEGGKYYEPLSLADWLAHQHLSASSTDVQSISVDGMSGLILPGAITGTGNTTVYLMSHPPSGSVSRSPYIYEVDFNCGGLPSCESDQFSFWRQMLESLRTLPPIVHY